MSKHPGVYISNFLEQVQLIMGTRKVSIVEKQGKTEKSINHFKALHRFWGSWKRKTLLVFSHGDITNILPLDIHLSDVIKYSG